jgi:hypothetical protein
MAELSYIPLTLYNVVEELQIQECYADMDDNG